jgi:hypothetical protein
VFHVISFEYNAIAYVLHLKGGGAVVKEILVVIDLDPNCRVLILLYIGHVTHIYVTPFF